MILTDLEILFALSPGLLFGYAYFLYPAMLRIWGTVRAAPREFGDPPVWPMVSIVVPSYNEEKAIRRTAVPNQSR